MPVIMFAGIFGNGGITIAMTVAFLRPLRHIWRRSKLLRDIFLRTALGGILHVLGIAVFATAYLWASRHPMQNETYWVVVLRNLYLLPLLFHVCISHRDDMVIREALWFCFSKAVVSMKAVKAASPTASPTASPLKTAPRKWSMVMAVDGEEEEELERISMSMPSVSAVEMVERSRCVTNPVRDTLGDGETAAERTRTKSSTVAHII